MRFSCPSLLAKIRVQAMGTLEAIAFVMLTFVLHGWALVPAAAAASQTSTLAYEAVIDAGSSGTRLYLYKTERDSQGLLVSLLYDYEPDALKGLSSHANQPELAGPSEIGPLLSGLDEFLKMHAIDHRAVMVSVLATAGMRLVKPQVASLIYQSVSHEIARRGFISRQVGTTTGQQEGIYAWLDVNYLKGHLRDGQTTVGIVEVGGASAQVALAVRPADWLGDAVKRVRVAGREYDVLSVSYLGLGQNEARQAMVQAVQAARLPQNPCYPNAASPDLVYEAVRSSDAEPASRVRANQANFGPACFDVYRGVIERITTESPNRFPLTKFQVVPGYDTSPFVLMASSYRRLKVPDWITDKRLDRSLLREVFSRCTGPNAWQSVSTWQGSGFFAQNVCANATFLYALVFSGRGLALSSSKLEVIDDIKGQTRTWTRGYVLLINDSR